MNVGARVDVSAPPGGWGQEPLSGSPTPEDEPAIDRASSLDLAMLSMDACGIHEQLGVLLLLDGPDIDLATVRRIIADRLSSVPRLRQHLVRLPPGFGRPIWVDDPEFQLDWHIEELKCSPAGGERGLLDLAAELATRPLPPSRPLWRVAVVPGMGQRQQALIFVLHHTLADGLGTLAAITSLLDEAPGPSSPAHNRFPKARPSWRRLSVDAARARRHAAAEIPAMLRELRASVAPFGGFRAGRAAACSVLHSTGPRRRLSVVRVDLATLRARASTYGATVNETLLAAVAGALDDVLHARGDSIDTLRIMVPVGTRRPSTGQSLGNAVAPVIVSVPLGPDRDERLRSVITRFRRARTLVVGRPMIALLGPVFRAAASVGLYRWLLHHQRRCHTEVSVVGGPEQPLTLAGTTISSVVPFSVGDVGSMTVKFVGLTYAGTLTVSVVADPDQVPDLERLTSALSAELGESRRLPEGADDGESR